MDRRVEGLKENSIPELLRELATETTTLVRQEIELAKVELTEKAKAAGVGVGFFAGAAVFGLGAFGAFTALLIELIALALPVWSAALIVTVLYAVIAAVLAVNGRKKITQAAPVVPEQTAQTVKEDVEWVKMRAQSSKK